MTRRSLVIPVLAALLLAPGWTFAQQAPAKIPRVGILTQASSDKIPIFGPTYKIAVEFPAPAHRVLPFIFEFEYELVKAAPGT